MIRQFVRYAIIGAGNTALDFGMYAILTRGFDFWRAHYLWANAFTFTTVVTWSFYWNKRWAFKNEEARHKEQYVKFVIVTIVGIAIAQAALYTGVQVFGWHDILTKVFVAPIVVIWNFLAYRLWAFRPSV